MPAINKVMLKNPFEQLQQGQQQREFNAQQFADLPEPKYTQEQGLAARQEIMAAIQASELPLDKLREIGDWAQRVIEQQVTFAEFQAWLKSQGLDDADIPKEPDIQELTGMVAVGNTAGAMLEEQGVASEAELAPKGGEVAGPVSPEQLQATAAKGRVGDTMLAHINPEEAAVLKSMGGMGTINPATGLPEFGFFSKLWDGIKKVVKKVAPIILPAVAIFAPAVLPAIGGFVTGGLASGAVAGAVGAAVVSGGITAISGGSVKDVLKSAALTGLGSYLTPIVGKYVGGAVGVTSASLQNVLGSGVVAGGFAALRGGSVGQILTAAATGAAGTYLGQIAHEAINGTSTGLKVTNTKATQQAFEDASFAAADAKQLADQGISKNQIVDILKASGLSANAANQAATSAVAGASAADIAVKLTNAAGSAKALYTDGQTGVQNSLIGGGNTEALTKVQHLEDAKMIAADAKNLRDLGLNSAQIQQNLEAAGVPKDVAAYAARSAGSSSLESSLITQYANKGTELFTDAVTQGTTVRNVGAEPTSDVASRMGDLQDIAADARQLRAQGLSNTAIKDSLIASGVDRSVATVAANNSYLSEADLVRSLNSNSTVTKLDNLYTQPVAPTETAGGTRPASGTPVVEGPVAPSGPNAGVDFGLGGELSYAGDIQSTGYSDSAPGTVFNGPNGPEVVLNSGKTILLSDYQAAIASGEPVSVDGMMQTQFRVEVTGLPYLAGPRADAANLKIPEGYRLATGAEAESGLAGRSAVTLEDGRMAWLVPTETIPVTPEVVPGTTGEGGGGAPVTPPTQVPESGGGGVSKYVVDGNTVSIFPDGTQVIEYADGQGVRVITPDGVSDFTPPTDVGAPPQPVTPPVQNPNGTTTQQFDNGSTQIMYPDGTTVSVLADGTQITDYSDGRTTINYPDGTSDTVGGTTAPTGGETTAPPGGGAGNVPADGTAPGTGTGGGTGGPGATPGPVTSPTGDVTYTYDDGSTITIRPDGTSVSTPSTDGGGGVVAPTAPTGPVDLLPLEPIVIEPTPPIPTVDVTTPPVDTTPVDTGPVDTGPGTPYVPPVVPPYVPTPIGPIIPPPPPVTQDGSYTLNWGTPQMPQTRFGLNPGLMEAVPQYQTTSPVQSQYYWGASPFQTGGPTGQVFDPNVARSSPYAPATPFGLQQMFTPETSANVMQLLLAGQNPYASVIPLTRQG